MTAPLPGTTYAWPELASYNGRLSISVKELEQRSLVRLKDKTAGPARPVLAAAYQRYNEHIDVLLARKGLIRHADVFYSTPNEVNCRNNRITPVWALELACVQLCGAATPATWSWERVWQQMLTNDEWRLAFCAALEASPQKATMPSRLKWLKATLPPSRSRVET